MLNLVEHEKRFITSGLAHERMLKNKSIFSNISVKLF